MKRCIEDRYAVMGKLQHLFVDGFMSLQWSNVSRRRRHGILFGLMMSYGSCGVYEDSFLIGC